jgi:hypothetical protein
MKRLMLRVATGALGAAIFLVATGARAQSPATPAAAPAGPTMATTGADSLAIARKYTAWFFTGQMDSLWSHQSAERKKENTPAQLLETLIQLTGQVGVEDRVVDEHFVKRLGNTQYWRTSQYSGGGEAFMVRMVLSPRGEFVGFGFNTRSQAPPVDP